jgi:Domain of unknown function (DUF4124)
MLRTLLFIAAFALAGAAAAQYKWTDSNGKVQYGDTPPPGVKATAVRTPPPLSQPEASAKKDDGKKDDAKKGPLTTVEKDADFRKRQRDAEDDREKQAKAQQEAQDKRDNCTRAREALAGLENGRASRMDAKGERYYLDEAQTGQEIARARQAAQQWCS